MSTLIVPMAGKSERFGGIPKWTKKDLLDGVSVPMSVLSVAGISNRFESIVYVILQQHANDFEDTAYETEYFARTMLQKKARFIPIESSSSQPETVMKGLQEAKISSGFMVKDCDNYWNFKGLPLHKNFVAYCNLEDYQDVKAQNKSYIQTNFAGEITNIAEKKVISSKFNIGGYGFECPEQYERAYIQAEHILRDQEFHISHLIYEDMLRFGTKYFGVECSSFVDWGTEEDWNKYLIGTKE